jgi:lipoprotein NlpD
MTARIGRLATLVVIAAALAGCVSRTPAPVVDRRAPAPAKPAPAPVAPAPVAAPQPDTYVVKRGDTLYSIALDSGVDWRELAALNQITDPSKLQVGQVLQVRPPAAAPGPDGVVVSPVTQGPAIAGRPLGTEAPPPAPGAPATGPTPPSVPGSPPAGGLRTEPKGLRLPYSDENLAAVQRADATRIAAAPKPEAPPAVAKPEPAPAAKPEPAPAAKPEAAPAPAPSRPDQNGGEDRVDWAWPAAGKVIATFNGASSKGVDIAGRVGDPVYASAPGRIVYSGEGIPAYGKLVIIRHNGTYLSAYAHNSQILVKEGQTVTRGQKIAEVGSSGAESPRLHFEIRRLGRPVDPMQYLPSR